MAPEPARVTARFASVLALLLIVATPAHALRVIDWNVLNYPGSTGATRDPLYRTVLAPLGVDVLVTEEQTSQAGVTEFLTSLNTMEPGQWAAAPFVPAGDTQAAMFYKPAKVQFLGQRAFWPNAAYLLRQINVYRLKPIGYTANAAEFDIYASHLKASSGSSNVATRLTEATGIRDSLNLLPAGVHVLVMGDMNFYTGLEGGMQKFVENQTNNIGRLYDPLGLENITWEDNASMAIWDTQSPCKSGGAACASGAATGGLDDRFDLILASYAFKDGAGLELVAGSYASVGNDGQHLNMNLTDAPTLPQGAAYASALQLSSDHLPVRVDIQLPAILSASTSPIAFGTVIVGATAGQSLAVTNGVGTPGEALTYSYAAPAGFTAPSGTLTLAAGASNNDALAMNTATAGSKGGSLVLTSNAVDSPTSSITLSGTVLRHAAASLDSAVATSAGALDFGTHAAADFVPMAVRVQNLGWDALQARLAVASGTITGGDGHFSIVGGFSPATLSGVGQTYSVAFDPSGATADSAYTATLTIGSSDEALPGAAAQGNLTVSLTATAQGSGSTAVGDGLPGATRLYSPFPNPQQGSSTIHFDVARAGDVAVDVFDVSGRRAATLMHRSLSAGRYSVQWSGYSDTGVRAAAGLYFVRMTAPGLGSQTARLAVVR